MGNTRNPFIILGVRPDADPVVAKAAYKALTKKFHPDTNPRSLAGECHQKMLEINWAMEELENDRPGWAADLQDDHNRRSGYARSIVTISVVPQLIKLRGSPGIAKVVEASSPGIDPSRIRARYQEKSWITVVRLETKRNVARFSVSVSREFRSRDTDCHDEVIEVSSPGAQSSDLFVVISPLLAQEYDGRRIIPTREISTDAIISFGKHKGRTFLDVAHDDPRYLDWIIERGAGTETERECAASALKREPRKRRRAA